MFLRIEEGKVGAWLFDAVNVNVDEAFIRNYLYRTSEIKEFLDIRRDNKNFVVATKGFGKTLLLKAKRFILQSQTRGVTILPENENIMVEVPPGKANLTENEIGYLASSYEVWPMIWQASIYTTIIKKFCSGAEIEKIIASSNTDNKVTELLRSEIINGVTDCFINLYDIGKDGLQDCFDFVNKLLAVKMKQVGDSVAIFIDNIDEHFNNIIQTSKYGADVWLNAQMGLIDAIYLIGRQNHNIKIYASIRKEAYDLFVKNDLMSLQYPDTRSAITYNYNDLRSIFDFNVLQEKDGNLIAPNEKDSIARFFGDKNFYVTHTLTRENELIFNYIYRHTLQRPRDLMFIGKAISTLPPVQRKSKEELKRLVNAKATEIATQYIKEFAPHVALDIHRLFRLIPGNVITSSKAREICSKYNMVSCEEEDCKMCDRTHIFCILYTVGLVGYVRFDTAVQKNFQSFLAPGEITLLDKKGVLPSSKYYLVHSILEAIVSADSDGYSYNLSNKNIVGDLRGWVDEGEHDEIKGNFFIVKADIEGFGRIMQDNINKAKEYKKLFSESIKRRCTNLLYHQHKDGDALEIINENLDQTLDSVFGVMDDLAKSNLMLRVAMHHGHIELSMNRHSVVPESTSAMRIVARMEVLGVGGQIIVSEDVKSEIIRYSNIYAVIPYLRVIAGVPSSDSDGFFNISKTHERPENIRLFAVRYNNEVLKQENVVNMALLWKNDGISYSEIARRLNSRGILPFSRKGQWDGQKVSRALFS
ncbi:MAG: hypothetical protein HQL56_11935 [Magnetococcales bacterium]|nr:hypothetical protein [Magnetococcales bacterium]